MRTTKLFLIPALILTARGDRLYAAETVQPERDAQTQAVALHPAVAPTMMDIQGTVQSIDPKTRMLQVKDASGHTTAVMLRPDTRILDDENHALTLTSLKKNNPVRVYYNRADDTAEQIDRLPTVADVVSGRQ